MNYGEWQDEMDTAEAYAQFNRHSERRSVVTAVVLGLVVVALYWGVRL